jgi:hypothetical protein
MSKRDELADQQVSKYQSQYQCASKHNASKQRPSKQRSIIINTSCKLFSRICILLLAACSGTTVEHDDADLLTKRERRDARIGKLFGEDALHFGGESRSKSDDPGSSIGVNAYLWRASLDTVSFMPLKFVDPFGGVILTDWYIPDRVKNERIKVDIRILDRQLRVDGVKVSVFCQQYERGRWVDMPSNPATARQLEDAILTRAREMKANAGR